jgi:hypothetical protein
MKKDEKLDWTPDMQTAFHKMCVCLAPWEEVAIDLSMSMAHFSTFTCIDTASNLVKLVRIENKSAEEHIRDKFAKTWLCRWYPRPICCVHDKGGEFIGKELQWLLELFSIKDVCSTSKNPSQMLFVNECIKLWKMY